MNFEIKARWTGKVLFSLETDSLKLALEAAVDKGAYLEGADLKGAYLKGADLKGAYLKGAYLGGAYLKGAYLGGAYLEGAYLEGAYLEGAYLEGADLEGADLEGAYLEGAYLEGAYLEGAYLKGADLKGAYLEGAYLEGALQGGKTLEIPTLEKPYTQILSAIKGEGNSLDMGDWHTCETTHCIGGWVTHLAGEKGKKLEALVGPLAAATLILKRSGTRIPNYFASNDVAMKFVEEQAKKESAA